MKTLFILIALAVAAVLIFNSCKSSADSVKSKSKVKDLWLNSHRPSPSKDYYSAQFAPAPLDKEWEELLIPIEGFTYTSGQIYHLRVKENLASDGETTTYTLVEIVSSETDPLMLITDIYVLSELPGEIDNKQMKDVRCTVEINASGRSIMGQGPCNQFSGKIEALSKTEISFGPIMATKMACPQMGIERTFFNRLGQVTGYERKGLLMHLTGESGKSLIILRKVD